jgi:hypothetical protein
MMYWNAYPWYINKKPTSPQLDAGVMALHRLVELLPRLRVIILSGVDARHGWDRFSKRYSSIAARFKVLLTHHTGNQAFVGSADVRSQRMAALRAAFDRAAAEIRNDATSAPDERQTRPPQPAPSQIALSDESPSPIASHGHVLLVGCLQEVETQRVLSEYRKNGVAASPWSFSLTPEQQGALRECSHLYVYRPAASWLQPKKAIVECVHVDDWRSSPEGIACPWPQLSGPYGQRTTLLDGKPIRTWFRVVGRSVLTVPITAHDALRANDGQPVNPKSPGLLSSFNLWSLKTGTRVRLPCLTTRS